MLRAKLLQSLPGALFLGSTLAIIGKLAYENQREHDVISSKFPSDCSDIIKDASEFQVFGKPVHGTLTSYFVKHQKTGYEYVKKSAHSREDLVKEFLLSNFLNAIQPSQPECLIMQTTDEAGTHFHTLSRKYPLSQDFEEFLRAGRINELTTSSVEGLEESLAAAQMIGAQSDTKLSNMAIREENGKLIISVIDHEKAVTPLGTFKHFFNPGRVQYPTDLNTLLYTIHDLQEKSDDNWAGLAGDPIAKQFESTAKKIFKPEKVPAFYAKVAKADVSPVIKTCKRLAKYGPLFFENECNAYQQHFADIQAGASRNRPGLG